MDYIQHNILSPELTAYELELQPLEFETLKREQLFGFDPAGFTPALQRNNYDSVRLTLIGKALDINRYKTLRELAENVLMIKALSYGGVEYHTYFSFVEDFGDVNSYTSAFSKFSDSIINKFGVAEYLSEEKQMSKEVKETITDVAKDQASYFMKAILGTSSVAEASTPIDKLEAYLLARKVPFEKEDHSFYFSTSTSTAGWEVELAVKPDSEVLTCYTSIPFKVATAELPALFMNLNDINLTLHSGNLEYSTKLGLLFYKSTMFWNTEQFNQQLTALLSSAAPVMESLAEMKTDLVKAV